MTRVTPRNIEEPENSAHMMFAEEQNRYLDTISQFLDSITS